MTLEEAQIQFQMVEIVTKEDLLIGQDAAEARISELERQAAEIDETTPMVQAREILDRLHGARRDAASLRKRANAMKDSRPVLLRVQRNEGDPIEQFRGPALQDLLDLLDVPRRHADRPQPPRTPTERERLDALEERLEALERGRRLP